MRTGEATGSVGFSTQYLYKMRGKKSRDGDVKYDDFFFFKSIMPVLYDVIILCKYHIIVVVFVVIRVFPGGNYNIIIVSCRTDTIDLVVTRMNKTITTGGD